MNVGRPWDPTALDEFIQCMQEFRQACGRPSLRELSRVSRRMVNDERYQNLPELSLAALSDVLSRRREGPPTFRWVASFVLSCQRFAAESSLCPDPGDSTLQEWNRRLQAVYVPDKQRTAEGNGGSAPLAAPTPDGQAPAHDFQAGTGPAPPPPAGPQAAPQATIVGDLLDDYVGEPGGASQSELRLFRLYGQYGVRLLKAAEDRDPDACYRLGVLLCIDDRPNESLSWLMQAEADGHQRASELIDNVIPRKVAIIHAHRLGIEATARGDAEVAETFLERAIRHGHAGSYSHAGAAFELGALWMESRDAARAVYWFTRAARCGHTLGQWWSDKIRHEAGWKNLRLPSLPSERSISVPTLADLVGRIVRQNR